MYTVSNIAAESNPYVDKASKEFTKSRKHFLWFGSVYQVLRGLDLVLEAFTETPELELYVCGSILSKADRAFVQEYRKELFYTRNIHTIGWVDYYSKEYAHLANKCGFMITATCTEGMSGSVINCMKAGIIPIATSSAGVDISQCGITIDEQTVTGVLNTIRYASELPVEECRRLTKQSIQRAEEMYTSKNFVNNITKQITNITENKVKYAKGDKS